MNSNPCLQEYVQEKVPQGATDNKVECTHNKKCLILRILLALVFSAVRYHAHIMQRQRKNKLKKHTFQHNERIPDPSGIPVDKCVLMKL